MDENIIKFWEYFYQNINNTNIEDLFTDSKKLLITLDPTNYTKSGIFYLELIKLIKNINKGLQIFLFPEIIKFDNISKTRCNIIISTCGNQQLLKLVENIYSYKDFYNPNSLNINDNVFIPKKLDENYLIMKYSRSNNIYNEKLINYSLDKYPINKTIYIYISINDDINDYKLLILHLLGEYEFLTSNIIFQISDINLPLKKGIDLRRDMEWFFMADKCCKCGIKNINVFIHPIKKICNYCDYC